ncbi:MAG: arylsulfatase [Microthrixaceae bacterium]
MITGPAYEGFGGKVGRVFATSESWWPERPVAPESAPNIVVVLVDDLGYADLGCYGSEIPTPRIDELAGRGLQYTNFHSTPMCSPTRASLLTGMEPHAAGVGTVAHSDPGFPGYAMEIAGDVATLPETLRANGWATYMVGKWHLSKDSDQSDAGPRHSWPCQRGFDRYYGFLDGFTNLHQPHRLIRDNSPVETEEYPPGYYLTDDLTDEAIGMIRSGKASDPTKPFMLYFAHGAVHAPLQAPATDIAAQRGNYDAGWDEIRDRRFARQHDLGVVDPDTELAPRNSEENNDVAPWTDLDDRQRELYARYMEVFAAMLGAVDRSTGRILDALGEMGELDNTIFVFTSDNGASREGEAVGTTGYMVHLMAGEDIDVDHERLELIGGPRTMPHYPRGWAMAGNTPFRLYKINTHAGGHTVPFLLSWPDGDVETGTMRRQYAHISDLAPTLLELVGIEPITKRDGTTVRPMTGHSFVPTIGSAAAPDQRDEAVYEMIGHRGFYRNGWEVVTLHQPMTAFEDSEWELYNLTEDPTELKDLAEVEPERLAELTAAWEQGAWDTQIFPLDEGTGLKYLIRPPRTDRLSEPLTIWPGTPTLDRWRSVQLIWLRSFELMATFSVEPGDVGTLVSHGDQSGGYALYVLEDLVPTLAMNDGRGQMTFVHGPALSPGEHTVGARFEALEGNRWRLHLDVDGEPGPDSPEVPMIFAMSPFEGITVGRDPRSPVWWERHESHGKFPFTGSLGKVTYTPGAGAPGMPDDVTDMLREMGARFE